MQPFAQQLDIDNVGRVRRGQVDLARQDLARECFEMFGHGCLLRLVDAKNPQLYATGPKLRGIRLIRWLSSNRYYTPRSALARVTALLASGA
ncbi:MAG: hypothetical protein Kow00120_13430 [Anaerolineae bacterium]